MNPATTFFRACRQCRRPTSLPSNIVTKPISLQSPQLAPFSSATHIKATPISDHPTPPNPSSAPESSTPEPIFSQQTPTDPSLPNLESTFPPKPSYIGTVTRLMSLPGSKTVRVTRQVQTFDRTLQKHYTRPSSTLVHDPDSILAVGDVIRYTPFPTEDAEARQQRRKWYIAQGEGKSEKGGVKFVVQEVVTPFGTVVGKRESWIVAPGRSRREAMGRSGDGGDVSKAILGQGEKGVKRAKEGRAAQQSERALKRAVSAR